MLAPFADPQHGDLRTLRFRKIARVSPAQTARVIATAQGGLPILLERSKGQGRCLLFAVPADNAWGDWAIHRLYLPLVHQVAAYLTDRLPGTGHVQTSVAGQGPARSPGVTIEKGHALVRNVDPEESGRRERTTLAKLREAYPAARIHGERSCRTLARQKPGRRQRAARRLELWRTVAWVLLIVLVVETFVANKTYRVIRKSVRRSSSPRQNRSP